MNIRRRPPLAIVLFILVSAKAFPAPVPRPEYPRPELVRVDWLNLNGTWDFAFDFSRSGEERGLPAGQGFDRTITVPFAPESPLSGVGFTDFIPAVWYKKSVTLPPAWKGRRILLHFEACDYRTTVWVNEKTAGSHQGGYTPFSFDITSLLRDGDNLIVVRAEDDLRSGRQPSGKQSKRMASYSCVYRRTTGIWQTVWLEPVPETRVAAYRIFPDLDNGEAGIEVRMNQAPASGEIALKVLESGKTVFEARKKAGPAVNFLVGLKNPKPWDIGKPFLYDFDVVYEREGKPVDAVRGYFGLRKFEVRGRKTYLNNRPYFMRLVLDQGFYPDGIYTAPGDAALRKDVELSQSLGFDGARLHQRVFERRFLYWADRLGYLVWGEFADWGLDLSRPEALQVFTAEWGEALERDVNHPSLIGWCPLNERWGDEFPGLMESIFRMTKLFDPGRPAIDSSGGFHQAVPDIYDAHDYEQNPVKFQKTYDGLLKSPQVVFVNGGPEENTPYGGQPYFLSEYGGIWWNPGQTDDKAWGYGERPRSLQEFLDRYKRLTEILLNNPAVAGYCYTQLYDIEQEVNGLMSFDRRPKHDPEYFRKIQQQPAAIEK